MTYFRSQTMAYCQALMPREAAWNIMNRLGQLDMLHIVSLPLSFESQFAPNIKRCDQTLTRIQRIKLFLAEFDNRKLIKYKNQTTMFDDFENAIKESGVPGPTFMSEIQEEVIKISRFFDQQKQQFDKIKQKRNHLIQSAALSLSLHDVVTKKQIFQDTIWNNDSVDYKGKSSKLQYKMGLINRKQQMILQKMVFRISKGNAWMQTFEIKQAEMNKVFDDPSQYSFIKDKIVFLILFQSGEHLIIDNKITKLLASFDCYIQPSSDQKPLSNILEDLRHKQNQINGLYRITKDNIKHYIDQLYRPKRSNEQSYLVFLQVYTLKEKTIYEALTQCLTINNFLSFKCFIPKSKLPELEKIRQSPGDIPSFMVTIKQPQKIPPSRFFSCEVIQIPQQIVNTYGVPAYQQFNPAPLYITTFGFFIGVMFGDVGHMILAALILLILRPNKWWWTVVFWMGYCGVIYNQFFGINLGFFSSCFRIKHDEAEKHHQHCVYPFGLDPVWKISSNQMAFTNSFKMKISVIIGVLHMSLGIILKGVNSVRKRNYLDLFTLVVPQFLFMGATFIYMDILIVIKWLTAYKHTSNAPSIINTLIEMFISNTHKSEFFKGQGFIQQFLMALAIVLIPFLLFAKPLIIWISGNGFQKIPPSANSDDRLQEPNLEEQIQKQVKLSTHQQLQQLISISPSNQDIHDFKQLMIHQLIETIEFVLGTVSNTASYLRLWALSLAHSQLSQVFFNLLLEGSLISGYSSIFKLTIVFSFFIAISFGVLVCMDVMQCFLHSLRLHWVQFQNKFFSGTGYIFDAYSFKKQIKKYEQK